MTRKVEREVKNIVRKNMASFELLTTDQLTVIMHLNVIISILPW
jgi:hypothetical protein